MDKNATVGEQLSCELEIVYLLVCSRESRNQKQTISVLFTVRQSSGGRAMDGEERSAAAGRSKKLHVTVNSKIQGASRIAEVGSNYTSKEFTSNSQAGCAWPPLNRDIADF
jgi:hypothetical protein